MPTETTPYIPHNPGDLITSEDWNDVQKKIKEDIAKQIQDAIQNVDNVPNADNAHKLENQSPDELTNDILEKIRQELPKRTGYKMLFKRLIWDKVKSKGEEKVIKHDLDAPPLVDVYQLDYFKVVCSADEEKHKAWVNFYLYHTSEKKIRFTKAGATETIEIEPKDGPPYRIPFAELLSLYKVKYTDATSLDDLVNEFWKALFADPNDEFDETQYCRSPWFDKCCCDQRTVADLKSRGDWNDLWFQMRPRKTINYLAGATISADGSTLTPTPASTSIPPAPTPAPTQIQVVHFDFETLGIKLLLDPVYPTEQTEEQTGIEAINKEELKVMVLLKV
ncbi:MAG: hypothetical protein ACHBNF_21475 [Chromatiales bacterium]